MMTYTQIFAGLGLILGPVLGGILYRLFGYSIPFLVIAGACFVLVPLAHQLVPYQADLVVSANDVTIDNSAMIDE